MFGRNGHFSEGEHGAGYHNYIHSPATLLGTPIQLLGNTNQPITAFLFQKLLIYWNFHAQLSLGFTENGPKKKISSERQLCLWVRKFLVDVRGQRRMGRLIRDDRNATVTQITTRYNQGMQNIISECTTRRTLKQMCYSSRRPHRVPLLSAKNRKRSIQFTQVHQNWKIED